MTPTTPDIRTFLGKLKRSQTSQWVGHLTPSEATSLVQAGAKANPQDLAWMERGLQAGSEDARWLYFSANPALRELLRRGPSPSDDIAPRPRVDHLPRDDSNSPVTSIGPILS